MSELFRKWLGSTAQSYPTGKAVTLAPGEKPIKQLHNRKEIPYVELSTFEERFARQPYFVRWQRQTTNEGGLIILPEWRNVPPTETFLYYLNVNAGGTAITDAERKQVKDIGARLKKIYEQYKHVGQGEAKKAFVTQGRNLADSAAKGEVMALPVRTREEIVVDFQHRQEALAQAKRSVTGEVKPIARTVAKRLAAMAQDLACEMDDKEKQIAEKYGVEFQPSTLLLMSIFTATVTMHENVEWHGPLPLPLLATMKEKN